MTYESNLPGPQLCNMYISTHTHNHSFLYRVKYSNSAIIIINTITPLTIITHSRASSRHSCHYTNVPMLIIAVYMLRLTQITKTMIPPMQSVSFVSMQRTSGFVYCYFRHVHTNHTPRRNIFRRHSCVTVLVRQNAPVDREVQRLLERVHTVLFEQCIYRNNSSIVMMIIMTAAMPLRMPHFDF